MDAIVETIGGKESVGTYFAPPERAMEKELRTAEKMVKENPLFRVLQESIDGYLMILNPQRQVLAVNQALLDLLHVESPECLVGQRPGEAVNCIHAHEGPGGCGTAPACTTCGAVISILASQNTKTSSVNECRVTVRSGEATDSIEFRVKATPLSIQGMDFTILLFINISGDKRRQALERVFFHDILNTVSGLMGWSSLLQTGEDLDPREIAGRIVSLSKKLTREIQDQRRLSQAESGSLSLEVEKASIRDIFEALRANFDANEIAEGKILVLEPPPPDARILTDPSLLGRILTNMVKNALEAISHGETVRVWYEVRPGGCAILVHNPGDIPDPIALQIFQRSFSTKSLHGRGLGTYSMKLFGEKYLHGKVTFTTGSGDGTCFSIELPESGPPRRNAVES